jgi:hypothetical protein
MSSVQVAEAVVEFVAKGVDRVLAQSKAVVGVVNQIAKAAYAAQQRLANMATRFSTGSGLTHIARMFSATGVLGIGGIAAGAARGTVELEQFGKAVDLAVRAVGDQFAPYLRMATLALADFAGWFMTLDREMVANVTKWALLGAGIAGAIAALPAVVGVLGAVGSIIATLLSPLGLVVAGVIAVAGVFTDWFGLMGNGAAEAANNVNEANRTWVGNLVDWIKGLATAFAGFWNNVQDWAAKTATFVRNTWKDIVNGLALAMAAAGEAVGALPKGTVDELWKDVAKEIANRKPIEFQGIDIGAMGLGMDAVAGNINAKMGDAAKMWEDLRRRAGEGVGFRVRMEGGGFENLQGTFDRLQKAFSEQGGATEFRRQALQKADQIKRAVEQVGANVAGALNGLPLVVAGSN